MAAERAFNSPHALISLIDRWRKSLENTGGAVLIDLSKAVHTINHDLLIAKFHAYGFDIKTFKLLHSYLKKKVAKNKSKFKFQ